MKTLGNLKQNIGTKNNSEIIFWTHDFEMYNWDVLSNVTPLTFRFPKRYHVWCDVWYVSSNVMDVYVCNVVCDGYVIFQGYVMAGQWVLSVKKGTHRPGMEIWSRVCFRVAHDRFECHKYSNTIRYYRGPARLSDKG